MTEKSSEKENPTAAPERRRFLKYAVAAVVSAVVAGAGTWALTRPPPVAPPATVTETVTKTAAPVTMTQTVTSTVTVTPTPTPTTPTPPPTTPTPTPTEPAWVIAAREKYGPTVWDRAINGAIEYIKAHPEAAGYVIKVMYPAGSGGHFAAKYMKFWEEPTGTTIKPIEVPLVATYEKAMEDIVPKTGMYDLYIPEPLYIGDLAESKGILYIDDWVKKYDPEIDHGPCPFAPVKQGYNSSYKGRWIGFPTDYDIWIAHRRTDIFENPDEKKAFESEFGYPLHPPDTWAEYYDFAKFFCRPDEPNPVSGAKGFWGVHSYRLTYFAKWEAQQRYITKGKLWFDDDMNPLINGPEMLEVFKEMDATSPYVYPGSWSMIWTDAYASFGNGEFGYNFSWTSMGKYSQNPAISKIYKWVGAAIPPGTPMTAAAAKHPHPGAVYGEKTESNPTPDVLRCGIVSFDWEWNVATYGKHPELSYLFMQWFTSPKQHTVTSVDLAAYFEPCRTCTWMSPLTIDFYNPEFMRLEYYNCEWTAPGPFIPGGAEYSIVWDKHVVAVLKKEETPEAALKAIEEDWKRITDELGRESQREAWIALKRSGSFGRNIMLLAPDQFKGIPVPSVLPPYEVAHVPGSEEYFKATRD